MVTRHYPEIWVLVVEHTKAATAVLSSVIVSHQIAIVALSLLLASGCRTATAPSSDEISPPSEASDSEHQSGEDGTHHVPELPGELNAEQDAGGALHHDAAGQAHDGSSQRETHDAVNRDVNGQAQDVSSDKDTPQQDASNAHPDLPEADVPARVANDSTEEHDSDASLSPDELVCPEAAPAEQIGTVQNTSLNEISGLVASQRNPEVFWVHNDSGAGPEIHAITATGDLITSYNLDGAQATDWEDIALGPFGEIQDALYLGDIGDNAETRETITIYVVEEPLITANNQQVLTGVTPLRFAYPDGAHNAETLLVDPNSGSLFVVTKQDDAPRLYAAHPPFATTQTITLSHELTLEPYDAFPSMLNLITGGDVASDGTAIILRSYWTIALWKRSPGATLAEAMSGPRCNMPSALEAQGEAIAFSADNSAYVTISEAVQPPVWRFSFVQP